MKTVFTNISKMVFLTLSLQLATRAQEAQITVRLVDDVGRPITGVTASMGVTIEAAAAGPTGHYMPTNITSLTDTNGMALLRAFSTDAFIAYGYPPQPGYYDQAGVHEYFFKSANAGQWQPWNPTFELVLRPILNPIPMYARMPYKMAIPELGKPCGFDLIAGDWVAPSGRGTKSDFIFQVDRKPDRTAKTSRGYQRDVKLFDATMTVTFDNQSDGLSVTSNAPFAGSAYRLARFAPEEGYEPQLVRRTYHQDPDSAIVTEPELGRDYFFRVRTVEKDGKIVSALYGKIAKDIAFDVMHSDKATIVFKYYLNPTPNDRNMEFDPKRNLFKNLNVMEQVRDP